MHGFFHWIADAADWLLAIAKANPESAFVIAFLVSFGESFVGLSFLVPGTTILLGLGFLMGAAQISFWPVWLAASLGAILGDWISYWLGRRYHEHVLDIWPVKHYRAQMDTALRVFNHWGVWAIFVGRFMGPFRATVPIIAGISRMSFWEFQIANVTSALLWAAVMLLGVVVWDWMKALWHALPIWAVVLVAIAAAAALYAIYRGIAAARKRFIA